MLIRPVNPEDHSEWAAMRTDLWPEASGDHISELNQYFEGTSIDIEIAFIVESGSEIVGFLELNIRNFAEGSREPKVPYVEAWFIKERFQGRGFGKALMKEAEKWALSHGYSQLASDTEWNNSRSIAMHKKLGFEEIERVVCFLKTLA